MAVETKIDTEGRTLYRKTGEACWYFNQLDLPHPADYQATVISGLDSRGNAVRVTAKRLIAAARHALGSRGGAPLWLGGEQGTGCTVFFPCNPTDSRACQWVPDDDQVDRLIVLAAKHGL